MKRVFMGKQTFFWGIVLIVLCFISSYKSSIQADTLKSSAITNSGTMWGGVSYTFDENTGLLTLTGGTLTNPADRPQVNFFNQVKKINFTQEVTAIGSINSLFMFGAITEIENASLLNTSQVTDMSYLFPYSPNLISIDVSKWDTSQVTNMSNMFAGLESVNKLDVSNFNTSQVTDMSNMFAALSSITTLDVSNFNTSMVKDMTGMFHSDLNLTSLDLSKWDMSSIDDINTWGTQNMFGRLDSLSTLILGSANKFNSATSLPEIQPTSVFTGSWINVGSGTVLYPNGTHVLISPELTGPNYDGTTMADTYVWQKTPTYYPNFDLTANSFEIDIQKVASGNFDILALSKAIVTDKNGIDLTAQPVLLSNSTIPAMTGEYPVKIGIDHDTSGLITKEITVKVTADLSNINVDPKPIPTVDPITSDPVDVTDDIPTVDPVASNPGDESKDGFSRGPSSSSVSKQIKKGAIKSDLPKMGETSPGILGLLGGGTLLLALWIGKRRK